MGPAALEQESCFLLKENDFIRLFDLKMRSVVNLLCKARDNGLDYLHSGHIDRMQSVCADSETIRCQTRA